MVFLREIESKLAPILTMETLRNAMTLLGECVASFDVEQSTSLRGGDDLLTAFIAAKEVEGRSRTTLNHYEYTIKRFLTESNTDVRKVTVYHIRSYLMNEKRRGISESTLEGNRSVFSSFFCWLQKEGLLASNPCANLGAIKCQKVVRKPFSDIDIERLKEGCKCIRDKAIISFLRSTGCRISEVCALNRNDVHFDTLECTVLGKGNKQRVVYVDSVTAMLLKRYLSERKDGDGDALFMGLRGERLQPNGVRVMLKTLAAKTGVENVHPHRFRRTLATSLIHRGMPIQQVSAVLGHDKIDTTMAYVYLDKSDVESSYRKYA